MQRTAWETLVDEGRKCRRAGGGGMLRLLARYVRLHLSPLPARPPGMAGLVVTLTSIPSRMHLLRPAILSLLDQDLPPAEIVVAVPRVSRREARPYRIPDFLSSCAAVTVLHCERDWGPATKLIPTWQRERGGDRLLVVVDDDNVYPPDLLSTLVRWHRELPHAAVGVRGWAIPPSFDYRQARALYGTAVDRPTPVDVITGTWGYLVHPSFFDDEIACYDGYPREAFCVDDIWFNGHLSRRGVPRYLVPTRYPPLHTLSAYRNDLGGHENRDGSNDNAVIQAFRQHWR